MLSQSELKAELSYDPKSGVFTRNKAGGGRKAGARAGGLGTDGYTTISVLGRRYRAARLAWLYMTGEHPSGDVDHINRKPTDDRWANLRLATRSQNCANTKSHSGLKGVSWVTAKQRWKAQIKVSGKNKHIGYFDCPIEANEAYKDAAIAAFGEYAHW